MSGNRTPDLSTIFRKAIAVAAAGLRVMEPAKVISYNEENQTATVLSLFKEADSTTEDAKELPQLIECPVWHLRVGLAAIYLPIRPGDKVALLFADKSLDNWQDSEGENPIDPQDTRTHDLTDALVIPGMYSPNDPIPNVDPADIRIVLYDTSGAIRSQFYLGGDTGDIVLLSENLLRLGAALASQQAILGNLFMTLYNAHIHSTGVGPSGPPAVPMSVTQLSEKVYLQALGD